MGNVILPTQNPTLLLLIDPLYLRDIKTLATSEKTILIFLLQSPDSGEAEAVFAESQQGFSN